jgi:hypothetical protein
MNCCKLDVFLFAFLFANAQWMIASGETCGYNSCSEEGKSNKYFGFNF